MELRHLRYFVAVAEDLSVTRAASRLNIAQPALSHQIKSLEEEIGTLLLERLPRGVALTDPGSLFAEDARAVLAAVEAATLRARRAAAGELGLIRIGFTGSASFHPFVTGAIRDYRAAYPDVQVELVEEPTANLLPALKGAASTSPSCGRPRARWTRTGRGTSSTSRWSRPCRSRTGSRMPRRFRSPTSRTRPSSSIRAGTGERSTRRSCRPAKPPASPRAWRRTRRSSPPWSISWRPASRSRSCRPPWAGMATDEVRYIPITDRPPLAPMALVRAKTPQTALATIFTDLVLDQV